MAKYTRLLRSIWTNPDFVALPAHAQRLYLLLISQPDITAAGVLPLMERRWSRLAPDTDADSVRDALEWLQRTQPSSGAEGFVIVDTSTDELWVRSYLEVDELYRVPNGRKSIASAVDAVTSSLLRNHIQTALSTLDGTVPATVNAREGPPQQPAAASKSLSESSSRSRDPSSNGHHPAEACDLPAAAAAALDLLIEHRLTTEQGIRDGGRYGAKIRRDELAARSRLLQAAADDGHDAEHIAEHVLGLTRAQVITAAVHLERSKP